MSSHLLPIFSPLPICLEKGEGLWLTDTEGNRYLDGFAGIAVNGVGHNHPSPGTPAVVPESLHSDRHCKRGILQPVVETVMQARNGVVPYGTYSVVERGQCL